MRPGDVYLQAFARVGEVVGQVVEGLTEQEAVTRVGPDANPIGWLLWHLARGQDVQTAQLVGGEQVYPAYADDFTGPGSAGMGYADSSEQVGAFRVRRVAALADYYDAVQARTHDIVDGVAERDEWGRVVDADYQPPVTVADRLTSILADSMQHAGQAAYVKGLL